MEILACPHCQRLFNATPAVLGKKIRCRGCRQIFHVPRDTTIVPLGPAVEGLDPGPDGAPPVAMACVVDGHDARRCPECGREFLMKAAFAGKVIRCRGCKSPFRVRATEGAVEKPGSLTAVIPVEAEPPLSVPAPGSSTGQRLQPNRVAEPPRPAIFEDIGDVLDDIQPGERVASVVRPRNAATVARSDAEAIATVVAIVCGGACALPIVQLILWYAFGKDPLLIGPALPDFLEWIAPPRWRG